MNSSASLLGLTVKDYFNLCNWQLLPPPSNNPLPKKSTITSLQSPIVLARLTAEKFFALCNWQLLPQLEPAIDEKDLTPLPQSAAPSLPTALPCLTVAEFFSLCNWHSLPLEVRLPQPSPLEPSLLTWQVQAFFQRISWEGSPEIGGLPQTSARSPFISPASGEMNLNDLSNLF